MRSIRGVMRGAVIALGMAVALTACNNGNIATAPGSPGPVGIRFGTASATGPVANVSAAMMPMNGIAATGGSSSTDSASLTITGTNGTLNITGVYLVVSRIQLEQADSACSSDSTDQTQCEDFKTPPLFISVPLDTSTALVVTTDVPAGTYVGLHLQVHNLQGYSEGEQHGSVTNAQLDSLLTSIQQQFPNWPTNASMLVTGSFTPTGGQAQPFSDYFRADLEVERQLNPPLVVSDTASTGTDLTVQISPAGWFATRDSTVVDLSKDNYATTHQVVEFESEMDHGFASVHEGRHHEGD